MTIPQKVARESFIAYWKGCERFPWRMLFFYVFYLGCLAVFAIVVRSMASSLWLSLLAPLVAIGYIILVPYAFVRWFHSRYSLFIRCTHCGDWYGRDASGAYCGPNPKFKEVIDTGRCSKCGMQVLQGHETNEPVECSPTSKAH